MEADQLCPMCGARVAGPRRHEGRSRAALMERHLWLRCTWRLGSRHRSGPQKGRRVTAANPMVAGEATPS